MKTPLQSTNLLLVTLLLSLPLVVIVGPPEGAHCAPTAGELEDDKTALFTQSLAPEEGEQFVGVAAAAAAVDDDDDVDEAEQQHQQDRPEIEPRLEAAPAIPAPGAQELAAVEDTAADSTGASADEAAGSSRALQEQKIDYYRYRHIFADGVQRALNECREKFKWDRWNCPKKTFLTILDRDEYSALPSNKELGLTRALISSSIVLSMLRSCSSGADSALCGCGLSTATNLVGPDLAARRALIKPGACASQADEPDEDADHGEGVGDHISGPAAATGQPSVSRAATANESSSSSGGGANFALAGASNSLRSFPEPPDASEAPTNLGRLAPKCTGAAAAAAGSKFAWFGCEQTVQLGFKVARTYLNSLDQQQDVASRLMSAHNYRVGLQAIRRTMKRRCKCHGASGTCQFRTCWTIVPTMSEVGDYLRRQYRVAAKVGAHSASETDPNSLSQELAHIGPDKLVFADSSPDYCYENRQLGVNGTLERYCSRAKFRADGTEVSRSERDSCDRLCTKCGYKIKKLRLNVEKQCDCRFVYCCSVECKRCPYVEEAFKCVRHS